MDEVHHIDVVHRLIDVLDALGIPYAIAGSMASSVYGPMRFTQDADITVQPFPSVADTFYDRIKEAFYVSEQAMRQALDYEYLANWAEKLGLTELLSRAIAEAGTQR